MILRAWIDPNELPDEMAITAIILAELSAGPHEARSNDEQSSYDATVERAQRMDVLQRAERKFDPIPLDTEAARVYGRVTAAVVAATETTPPCPEPDDASIAIAEALPLYTTRPDHFVGLEQLLTVVAARRPVTVP